MLGIGVIMTSVIAIATKPVHNLVEYDENTTLALFDENGDKIAQLPSKDSGYTLDTEKSSCTNGSISWNIESWSPVVTVNNEVNGRVSCNLYFKKATDYEICVAQYGSDSIQCSIIAQLDTTGACPSVNEDGIVEVTAAESENAYLCSAPDDYGTSYYYRGTVENNYVKFAGLMEPVLMLIMIQVLIVKLEPVLIIHLLVTMLMLDTCMAQLEQVPTKKLMRISMIVQLKLI